MTPGQLSQIYTPPCVQTMSESLCIYTLCGARAGNREPTPLSLALQPRPESLICSLFFLISDLEDPNRGHPNLCQLCIRFPSILTVFRGICGIPCPDQPAYIRGNKRTLMRGAQGSAVCCLAAPRPLFELSHHRLVVICSLFIQR